jgi:hypothetical protein
VAATVQKHHLAAHPPLAVAAAVDRDRTLVDGVGKLRVAHLQPRQHRSAGASRRSTPSGPASRSIAS